MAQFARAVFLQTLRGGVAQDSWQNYYHRQTVNGHSFLPFDIGGLTLSESGAQDGMDLILPDFEAVASATEEALAAGDMAQVTIYEFNQPTVADTLPGTETTVASFLGRVVMAERDFRTIKWTLGSALSARLSNAPGTVYTTKLVGVPLRL